MLILAFAFIITICGTSAAATPQQNTTIISNNSSSTLSTLQSNSSKAKTTPKGDPIITGTVTINEFGSVRPLKGATVTVNTTGTNSRVLGTSITDQYGHYSINFYSTSSSFKVTSSYLGCNSITNNPVSVTLNNTDGISYGTSNFQLTPKIAI